MYVYARELQILALDSIHSLTTKVEVKEKFLKFVSLSSCCLRPTKTCNCV